MLHNETNKSHFAMEKKKKKLYNPFQDDQEYYSVDEKMPIQVKSKIPHWVPSKNSDIFEVRKVMVTEKEQIRNINRSLGVYKQDNKILISKNILEEEAKKSNQKIRTNLKVKVIKEEKSKHDLNDKLLAKKPFYNFKNSIKLSKEKYQKYEKNENEIITENNSENNEIDSRSKESKFNLNTVDKIDYRKNKANNRNSKINSVDFGITNLNNQFNGKSKNRIMKGSNNIKDAFDDDKNKREKTQKKKNNETDNFDTHKANTSILITSLLHENPAKVDDVLRLEAKKEYKRKFDTSILHELKEEKEEKEEKKEKKEKEEKEENQKAETKQSKQNSLAKSASFEPPITSSLRYSVREYINKTRDIVLLRHSVDIKKETTLKMQEEYTNQIQSVSESITSLKQTKVLFEDDFITKFDRYVKYLRLQREKELNQLNAILDFKSQLELEIQKLETRKFKTKARLNLYREYRDFLICVKERSVCLPTFFNENENYKNNIVNTVEFNKTKNSKNSKLLNNSKYLNFNYDNIVMQINNGNYSDLESDMDEDEKIRIIIEREKLQKMRSELLNQLQSNNNNVSNNDSLTNFNNSNNNSNNLYSPRTKTTKNVCSNTMKNNILNKNANNINIKDKDTQNIISNEGFNINNSSKKQFKSLANNNKKSTKKVENLNLIQQNTKSLKNVNNLNLNSNFDNTDNSENVTKHRIINKNDLLDPTLIGVDIALIEKFNIYVSKPIYETTEELNEEIKKLQLENINLLKKLTSTSAKGNLLKQQLDKMKKQDKGEFEVLLLEVQQREDNIKKIKEINISLQEEKSMLIGIGNGFYIKNNKEKGKEIKKESNEIHKKTYLRKSLVKAKFNQVMLYSKVAELFNLFMDLPMNAKESFDFGVISNEKNNYNNSNSEEKRNNIYENNFILNMSFNNQNKIPEKNYRNEGAVAAIDKEANLMRMLRLIEKTIDNLLAKHSNYLRDPKKSLLIEKIKIEVEKDRKVRKAIDTRLKDEKRREIISQAIIERNNRPVILPNKKYGERNKPVERKISSLSVNKNKEDNDVYDLILY